MSFLTFTIRSHWILGWRQRVPKGHRAYLPCSYRRKRQIQRRNEIPADLSEVWLSSDYLATVSPLNDSRRLLFNQDAYIATLRSQTASKTRGVTVNQHTYLKEWHVLPDADWDDSGRPTNLEPKINIPPADVLYNIKYVFRKVTVERAVKARLWTSVRIIRSFLMVPSKWLQIFQLLTRPKWASYL